MLFESGLFAVSGSICATQEAQEKCQQKHANGTDMKKKRAYGKTSVKHMCWERKMSFCGHWPVFFLWATYLRELIMLCALHNVTVVIDSKYCARKNHLFCCDVSAQQVFAKWRWNPFIRFLKNGWKMSVWTQKTCADCIVEMKFTCFGYKSYPYRKRTEKSFFTDALTSFPLLSQAVSTHTEELILIWKRWKVRRWFTTDLLASGFCWCYFCGSRFTSTTIPARISCNSRWVQQYQCGNFR